MAAEGKKSSQSLQFPAFEPAKLTDKQYRKMAELKLAFIEIKGHTGSMSNYTDKKCQEKKTGEARNSAKEHQKKLEEQLAQILADANKLHHEITAEVLEIEPAEPLAKRMRSEEAP